MARKILKKEQCPMCKEEGLDSAEDNLVTFADTGVKYCHRHHVLKSGLKDLLSSNVPWEPEPMPVPPPITGSGLIEGEYAEIKSRGLTKETCEFYGYQINREKALHIANYCDAAGQVKMQQLRTADKKFPIQGDKSYNETLWGMHKFTPNENVFITITEGHIDALSVAQAFDCKYPVVSLPNGCAGAVRVITKEMHKLVGFKYVVLAFDNDEPGRKATEECLKLFEPGKVRVVRFGDGRKDASDYLQAGDVRGLRDAVYNAVAYIPPSILTGQALLDTLKDYKSKSIEWPWASFNKFLQPIYVPGIYTIAALPGVGKTVLMADIMRSVIASGKRVGVISLEESVQKLLIKITTMLTGVDLRGIRNRVMTDEEVELCRTTSESIATFDHKTYGSDLIKIVENLPYIAQSLECEVIIFDNLSYSATSAGDDERRAIDTAMIQLKDSSTKYEYVLFNICHLNDTEDPKAATIRGSRGVAMYSDFIIHLSRNTEAENELERNTLTFHVKKDRETGEDTGKFLKLRFNPETKRLGDM